MPTNAPFAPISIVGLPFPGRRMSGGGSWNVVTKTADESQNNANGGTTLRADATLRFPIVAGQYYRARAIIMGGALVNGTPDIKTTFLHLNTGGVEIPGGAMSFFVGNYTATPNANTFTIEGPTQLTPSPHTALPAANNENTSSNEYDYIMWEIVFSPAQSGFLAVAWAQVTASVFFTSVLRGSTLEWIRC